MRCVVVVYLLFVVCCIVGCGLLFNELLLGCYVMWVTCG